MKNTWWQGEWIDEAELLGKIDALNEIVANTLQVQWRLDLVLAAAQNLSERLKNDRAFKNKLLAAIATPTNSDTLELEQTLSEIADFLQKENLQKKIKRELGSESPFTAQRISYESKTFEQWGPLGVLVHVTPANVSGLAFLSTVEGLLCGNINIVKTSKNDSLLTHFLCEALCAEEEFTLLRQFLIIAQFSSSRSDLLQQILIHADGIAAWGGEEALQALRKISPPSIRFIDWGHKISFAYVAQDRIKDPTIFASIVKEACLLEQQACSSPQCVYVETDSYEELKIFATQLAQFWEKQNSQHPPQAIVPEAEAAEITKVCELHKLEKYFRNSSLLEDSTRTWRILLEERSALRASPLYRSLWVKPLPRNKIIPTLRPMRHYLQTVGLASTLPHLQELITLFSQAGILRVREIGEMLSSYAGEPHDGVYALQRYSKRLNFSFTTTGLENFTSLSQLKKQNISAPKNIPLMTREIFQTRQVPEQESFLFFKSGGSSGEAKLSIFTYEDYHLQMQKAAEGLVAAGLRPTKDRCMNLFFAGGLYGGFLSFFTILEHLQARQFPMAAHFDFEMVVKTIVDQKVNVLLGMPSYLLQLFEAGGNALKGKIDKIFFGGEHFMESQRLHLKNIFGVQSIKSATYGSVDAGPLGYQCTHCTGSIHHLQSDLQILEILKLDEDKPVQENESGRLIFTSRQRRGQNIFRYDIGDVGRWILGSCECGHQTPRFELLGRQGDTFRAAGMFFNYAKFTHIFSQIFAYSGELQIGITQPKGRDCLSIFTDQNIPLREMDLNKKLLDNYPDLYESVVKEKSLSLEFIKIPSAQFQRTKGSGKLIHIIDNRKP